jgi:hypothetical protein
MTNGAVAFVSFVMLVGAKPSCGGAGMRTCLLRLKMNSPRMARHSLVNATARHSHRCKPLAAGLVRQIVDRSRAPVIRSHDTPLASGVGGEATDELIASVVRSGEGHGVFALHFYSDYYSGDPSLDRLVLAARHVIDRGCGRTPVRRVGRDR